MRAYFWRSKWRVAAWFALLALSWHLLLPFVHALQIRDTVALSQTLCRTIAADAKTTAAANDESSQQAMPLCPVCVASSGAAVLPEVTVGVLSPHVHAAKIILKSQGVVTPTPAYTLPRSHAPPLV